jgi:RNA polymerase sigma-70 factor, ECF subfamily
MSPMQKRRYCNLGVLTSPETAEGCQRNFLSLRNCERLGPRRFVGKMIIDLVYYHEKSVEEVAEIVGIPENTVKTRMFYARKRLAELLKSEGIERGWP